MIILHDYRVRQRDHLLDIARALTENLDLDEVLRRILEASASMLAGEISLIALPDEHDELKIQAAFGVETDQMDVFDDMLEDFQTLGFDADRLNLRTRQIAKRLDKPLRQVVALPMLISSEPLGLILVFRTFSGLTTQDDRQILQSFADQAAIAVQNARLFAAVANEKQRLSAILENSADGIMILDDERVIQRFNHALGSMTAWKPDMAIGRHDSDVIRWQPPLPALDLDEMLNSDWPENRPVYAEGDIERLDGLTLSVGITYAVIRHPDGRPVNIIASVRDITNFRKAEQMKDTFISIVSHELKTPVALIKGYAGTLRREDAQWNREEYDNALAVIEEEADRLTGLIENLLAASKLKAEGMRLSLSDVELAGLARRVVERFQTQTADHTFQVEFPLDFPLVRGDDGRLRQTMDNLISNAIKYSPKGGNVVISGDFDEDQVRVSVSDEGVGIPSNQLDKLFDRFYRVDDALSRTTQGAGLGLYLVQAVIEAHGGKIWVESDLGQGTTFTFSLPLALTGEERKLIRE